jgi:ArsR family transcriptional regulator
MSNYRNDIEGLANVFKALSNPHRLRIFLRLLEGCPEGCCYTDDSGMRACVGEVGKDLGIVPSTVSHHIKELDRAGLIDLERDGQRVLCRVNPEAISILNSFNDRLVPNA